MIGDNWEIIWMARRNRREMSTAGKGRDTAQVDRGHGQMRPSQSVSMLRGGARVTKGGFGVMESGRGGAQGPTCSPAASEAPGQADSHEDRATPPAVEKNNGNFQIRNRSQVSFASPKQEHGAKDASASLRRKQWNEGGKARRGQSAGGRTMKEFSSAAWTFRCCRRGQPTCAAKVRTR